MDSDTKRQRILERNAADKRALEWCNREGRRLREKTMSDVVRFEEYTRCWICEESYEGEHCPRCGPSQPWGPTLEEHRREKAREAADDLRELMPDFLEDI